MPQKNKKMKRSLKELLGYTLEIKDGNKGKTKDFLFDEKTWIIRYMEADFGNWLESKRVLIPRVFLKPPIWEDRLFPVDISQSDIEKCPDIEDKLTVSRQYEEEMHKHYQTNPYWGGAVAASRGLLFPPRPIGIPKKAVAEDESKSILRSFNQVEGYHIQAINGKLGHIDDIIIDDTDWQIVYLIVDTKNWLPWSKKVVISADWMDDISYLKKEIKIRLKIETIKNAPEYQSNDNISLQYEKSLYDYYSQSLIK